MLYEVITTAEIEIAATVQESLDVSHLFCLFDNAAEVPFDTRKGLKIALDNLRITSYNVCYTKLLRAYLPNSN